MKWVELRYVGTGRWTLGGTAGVPFSELPRTANVGHIFTGTLCGFPARQMWRLIFNGILSAFQWQEVKWKRLNWPIHHCSTISWFFTI